MSQRSRSDLLHTTAPIPSRPPHRHAFRRWIALACAILAFLALDAWLISRTFAGGFDGWLRHLRGTEAAPHHGSLAGSKWTEPARRVFESPQPATLLAEGGATP